MVRPDPIQFEIRLDHPLLAIIAHQRAALEAAHHALTTLHGLIAHDGAAPGETWMLDESATIAAIDAALTGDAPSPAPDRAVAMREAAEAIRNGPWRTTVGRSYAEQAAEIVDALAKPEGAPAWVPWPTSEGFWWQRLRHVPAFVTLVQARHRDGEPSLVVESMGCDYVDVRSAITDAAMEFTPARIEEPPGGE